LQRFLRRKNNIISIKPGKSKIAGLPRGPIRDLGLFPEAILPPRRELEKDQKRLLEKME